MGIFQKELAAQFQSSHNTIGKYERDESTSSIDVAKKRATILDTTVGYLLGETEQDELFKDKKMLQRFIDINLLPEEEKNSLLMTVDHFIKASKVSML